MRAIPLIRAASAAGVVRFLSAVGAPVERTWERAGLPPAALAEPERLVPLRSIARFVDESAATQGIEDLGLRAGATHGLETMGTFGGAIRGATTIGDTARTASAAVSSFNSSASHWVTLDGDRARLCRRLVEADASSVHVDLVAIAIMVNLLRRAAGPDWTPSRIEIQCRAPFTLRERGILGDADVRVGGPVTSVEFPRKLLGHRLDPPPAPVAAPSISRLTEWQRSAPPKDFRRSVELLLTSLLKVDRADVRVAADAAGLTVRSFQRRLAECGLTWSGLVDDVRHRKALEMLDDPEVKMIDVAFALAYSDPAHFTRAFRRWCSIGPLEYRRLRAAERDARSA
jgi:AraC-like DNA-binding protein